MHNRSPLPHANNFDALRIAAALTVLAVHQRALMGQPEPGILGIATWAGVAVWVFFVISGYLVAQSWFADPQVLRFAQRRVLRIWPALTAVVLLSVLVVGPWMTSLPLQEYWRHDATWAYLRMLAMETRHVLPGVFDQAPGSTSVNGSLWTIPFEVQCYIAMAVVGGLGLLRSPRWLLAWVAVFAVWYVSKGLPDRTGIASPSREFPLYFLSGAALFCLRSVWQPHRWLVMVVAWLIAATLWYAQWRYLALTVAVPITVLAIGTSSWPLLRRAGRFGDPSYGLYLYAFPIQQILVHFTYPRWSYLTSTAIAMALTVCVAYASWYWIEKPALRFKPKKRT